MEILDSWQLRVFVTLARCRSFTQAARELHVMQSAVSHSVKALEEHLGCRLLDRVGRRMALTVAGEQLLTHAHRILAEMSAATEALRQLNQWGRGRLRLMASLTACQYLLPRALREFRRKFPEYSLTVESGDTPSAVAALLEQRIDLALALRPHASAGVTFRPLFRDALVFVVSPRHPWAQRGQVNRSEISTQPFILYSKSSVTFRLVEEYFQREGIVLASVVELGSMEAAKELVKLDLGITVVAPWVAQKELAEGSLVALPLGRRELTREWGILHLQGKNLSWAEETLVSLCRAVAQDLQLSLKPPGRVPGDSAAASPPGSEGPARLK